jgi:hypothetical protein
VEDAGIASGRVDLVLDDETTAIRGIGVHLFHLSRNDPSAIVFPPDSGLTDDDRAELVDRMLPHLRMLVRGRVVPLEASLVIPSASRDSRQA